MPGLSAGAVPSTTDGATDRTAAELRAAFEAVAADPVARDLAATTTGPPDPDGALGTWLYGTWWSRPASPAGTADASPAAEGPPSPHPAAGVRHVAGLEEMRRTAAVPHPGMLVLACTPGHVVVVGVPGRTDPAHPAPQPYPVAADAVVGSSRPGRPPRPGDLVAVLSGSSGVQPVTGWWWASTGAAEPVAEPVDRLYVHVGADGAGQVVAAVLRWAAGVGVDVSLKCHGDPRRYGRRDALVVYHPRTDRERVDDGLPQLADAVRSWLEPGCPPLTARVADGLAWAEDPGAGLSYGQLRCAQTATVVADLLRTTSSPTDAALLTAARGLGIDPAAPHRLDGAR